MAYLESGGAVSAFRMGQRGSSAGNNILDTVNLYHGAVAFPLSLVSLPGRDGLSVSVQASFQDMQPFQMKLNNRSVPSSVLGFGWKMPIARIVVGNRGVRESYQSSFYLTGEGGEYPLYRKGTAYGAVEFFSVEHPLWQFLFYDGTEEGKSCWKVKKEDGSTWIYGGTKDSVETALCWDNWAGAAINPGGEPWAVGWCLSRVESYNRSSLTYRYENVKETLGDGVYTRTIRLAAVISSYGERIEFSYRPKEEWEYQPEHRSMEGNNAFQCQWEDCYLYEIAVKGCTGTLQYTQRLEYDLQGTVEGTRERKRMLASVTQIGADGTAQPPIRLSYGNGEEGNFPGALYRVDYPLGEAICYEYEEKEFPLGAGSARLQTPGGEWSSQLIQGADFTVALHRHEEYARIQVLYWDMGWHVYEPACFAEGIFPEIRIMVGQGFFVVTYYDTGQASYMARLVKRNPVRRFDWDVEEHIFRMETTVPAFACGMDFFAAQYHGQALLEIAQFDYTDNRWHWHAFSQESYDFAALGAGNGCLFGAFYQKGGSQLLLRSFYADESHVWREGESHSRGMKVTLGLAAPEAVWSVGQGQASAVFLSAETSRFHAEIILLRWRRDFSFADVASYEVCQKPDVKNPILYGVNTGTVIGFAHTAFRYTPGDWNPCTLFTPVSGGEYRYAYGSDLALAAERRDGRQRFVGMRFDPYNRRWTTDGAPYAEETGDDGALCIPCVFGDFAVLGRKMFARSVEDQWEEIYQFAEDADMSSIQAPPDAGCLLYQNRAADETVLLSLYNQKPQESVRFQGQACTLADSMMVRSNAFFTCTLPSSVQDQVLYSYYLGEDHRYRQLQTARVVSRTVLETGFDRQSYRFGYVLDSARLEGELPAFATVRIYPEGGGKSFGYMEHQFFNGMAPDSPYADYPEEPATNVKDFYSHMAGRLSQSVTYDGEGQPVTGAYTRLYAMDRHGYCIRETKTVSQTWLDPCDVLGGRALSGERVPVESVIETEYEPQFYQARKITKYGTENTKTAQYQTYAWEIYPELLEAHLYDAVAMNRKAEETTGEVLEASGVLWEQSEDGIWREESRWRFDGNGEAEFRFRPDQAGWFLENRVIKRGKMGEIVQIVDQEGLHTFYGYDADSRFVVSRFSGAAGMEPLYCGFEPYEKLEGWAGLPSAPADMKKLLTDRECYSGSRCLALEPGVQVQVQTVMRRFDMPLLFSLALKTPLGQEEAGRVELCFASRGQVKTISQPLRPTDGVWQKQEFSLMPPQWPEDEEGMVTLRLTAPAEGSTLVDIVALTLAGCPGWLYVYDPDTLLQLAEHPTVGRGKLMLYDERQRPIAASFDDGVFSSCTRYTEGYGQGQPDEVMAVEMPQGGLLANFCRGLDFARQWQAEGPWETKGGKLFLPGNGRQTLPAEEGTATTPGAGSLGTLAWQGEPGAAFLLYLQWEEACDGFSMLLDSVVITYREQGWRLRDGGTEYDGGKTAPAVRESCHLLFVNGRLGFWAGGRQIFARKVDIQEIRELKLSFSAPCSLRGLGFCPNPKVQVTYNDYVGRTLQEQAVTETGVVTTQTLYDELGQAVVRTKQALAQDAMWAYRADFVKSFDWDSGVMEGEVADAYEADKGYPYARTLYLQCASPRARALGQPGADYAIRSASEKDAPIIKNQCADAAFAGCRIETVREPDDKVTATVYDQMDRQTAVIEKGGDGQSCCTYYEYDSRGNLVRTRLPNAGEEEAGGFVLEAAYDFLGHQTSKTTPDSGISYTAFDRQGRLRFSQSAGNREAGSIVYHLYDWMGRETEVGIYAGIWEEETMQALAREPCAGAPAGARWSRRMEYDGDGSDPLLFGRLWRCHSNWEGVIVTETFAYDRCGNIICHEQEVDGHRASVRMVYDESGNLMSRSIGSADGDELSYRYDMQGRMVSVQYKETCLCRYEYRPEGGLGMEIFAPDSPGCLERVYSYNSCHWLTEIKDRFFHQVLSYQAAGGESGRIIQETSEFSKTGDMPDDILKRVRYSYGYDGLGRLNRAVLEVSSDRGGQDGQTWAYSFDGNGNVLRINDATLTYEAGTNRLRQMKDIRYQYTPDGMITEISGSAGEFSPFPSCSPGDAPGGEAFSAVQLKYDPVLQTVTESETTQGKVRYYYNAAGGVAACDDGSGRTYFLLDTQGRVLSRTKPDGSVCICVRGVNGIFAEICDGKVYYLLKDQRDSVRAVYDGEKLCAAYHYLPFGGYLGKIWEKAETAALLPLRFAGQILEFCGLYRLKARWYDPLSGRFLSIDPESQFASPYLYGASDWINYIDPDGAYSGWSALAGVTGFLMVVGGAILSICTAGMASPVGAVLATLGASALMGAGIGTTIYAVTSSITGDFNWKDCLINGGAGAIFGMLGAGLGAAFPAGFTIGSCSAAVSSYIVDIGVGVVVGAADSVVTNGCLNVVHGKDFAENIGTNLLVGAAVGGIMSGIGGLGHALRNARTMGAGGARTEGIGVGRGGVEEKISHASVWKEYSNVRNGTTQITFEGTDHLPQLNTHRSVIRCLDGDYHERFIKRYQRINVSSDIHDRLAIPMTTRVSPTENFNLITNNCTTYSVNLLARAGIATPIWVRSPSILMMWAKCFAVWQ